MHSRPLSAQSKVSAKTASLEQLHVVLQHGGHHSRGRLLARLVTTLARLAQQVVDERLGWTFPWI